MHLRVQQSRHSFSVHNNEKNNNNYSKRMIYGRENNLLRHRVVTIAKRINGNVRINNNNKHNHGAMSKARRLIIRCASSNYNNDDNNNDNNNNNTDNDNEDDVSYDKLRQVEAQAAALRLELERRKRMNDNNGSSSSNDTDDANDESGSSKKKKKRRMSYTQLQSSQANSISDLIGYVNRGARGVSELELLDSSSSSSPSSSDGIDSDSNLRRNIIISLILTLSFSLLSQIRLPVYSFKGTLKGNRELYLYLITAVRLTEQLEGLKQVTMRLTIIILMVIMEHNSNSIVFTVITINSHRCYFSFIISMRLKVIYKQ